MLKKEVLELCLLCLLTEEELYGYELLRRMRKSFPDVQESVIYALMRGLCREGFTQQYLGEHSEGPTRKYYKITPAGEARRQELLGQWRRLRDALEELGVR